MRDLLSLFFVSKTLMAAVVRFLRSCKVLRWHEYHSDPEIVSLRPLMHALVAKHCRALRLIGLRSVYPARCDTSLETGVTIL